MKYMKTDQAKMKMESQFKTLLENSGGKLTSWMDQLDDKALLELECKLEEFNHSTRKRSATLTDL